MSGSRRAAVGAAGLLACLFACGPAAAQAASTAAAAAAPPVPLQVDATFKAWDTDHDGLLSPAEFRGGWSSVRDTVIEGRLRTQFDKVDKNRSGAIEPDEYAQLVLVKAAGDAAPPLSTFDADNDRRLDFAEYMAFVRRQAAALPPAAPAASSPPARPGR